MVMMYSELFKCILLSTQGLTVLFHGAPGTGKTLTAEAIGYEVGKPLKVCVVCVYVCVRARACVCVHVCVTSVMYSVINYQ